jgi:hypothetical protein
MTTVLEAPNVEQETTTEPGDIAHYAKRRKITDAYVFGQPLEALCGYVFVPCKNPERLPVCQRCREIYEDMKP